MPKLLQIRFTENRSDFEFSDVFTGFDVIRVGSLSEGSSAIAREKIDCILIDSVSPEMGRVEALEFLQVSDPSLPTLFWDPEMRATDAARLIRAGAYECLGNGDSLENLREALWCAVEEKQQRDSERERIATGDGPWRRFLVGRSPAMESVVETIRLIGPRRCTVLICGETGTGKEMAARALHMASSRAQGPFVAVNCNALPDGLLEAELFGHAKGAFTGAVGSRMGRFEQANRGTIFLDEIGDMPLDLQAKLLRVLQEREIQRLGSPETVRVDVRVIAATNADLYEKIQAGKFRQDLYYRLNVVPLSMPALRQRVEDIPPLVGHFLDKICRAEGLPVKGVTPEAVRRLRACPWPGNVRQLENTVEMAVALSGDREILYPSDFGLAQPAPSNVIPFDFGVHSDPMESMDFNTAVARFERAMLERALQKTTGNKTAAAELLGLKRTTLIMKLRGFGSPALGYAS